MKILLTGATGFVGSQLLNSLLKDNESVYAIGRSKPFGVLYEKFLKAPINDATDYKSILTNVDVIIHCAARAHVMNDEELDPLSAYREVNTQGTINLARQAAECGVNRFIFISSIKVNGESTEPNYPFSAHDNPSPIDSYGVSKLEAEQGLLEIASQTGMELVIIRPVLVYGPGVKANFYNMMKWLDKGYPLPFGAVSNKRSLVFIDNLIDLIKICINHPAAVNQVFLASDGEDISMPELLKRLGLALDRPAKLINVPVIFFKVMAGIFRKTELVNRTVGSLAVDISKNKALLGWVPNVSVDEGLDITAQDFLKRKV